MDVTKSFYSSVSLSMCPSLYHEQGILLTPVCSSGLKEYLFIFGHFQNFFGKRRRCWRWTLVVASVVCAEGLRRFYTAGRSW